MRHPHDAARRQERTVPDPREVSGIDGINAEADAKQQAMENTHGTNGTVPISNVVAKTEISEEKTAYLDDLGTIHVANPNHKTESGEVIREFSVLPHEVIELSAFVMDQFNR